MCRKIRYDEKSCKVLGFGVYLNKGLSIPKNSYSSQFCRAHPARELETIHIYLQNPIMSRAYPFHTTSLKIYLLQYHSSECINKIAEINLRRRYKDIQLCPPAEPLTQRPLLKLHLQQDKINPKYTMYLQDLPKAIYPRLSGLWKALWLVCYLFCRKHY